MRQALALPLITISLTACTTWDSSGPELVCVYPDLPVYSDDFQTALADQLELVEPGTALSTFSIDHVRLRDQIAAAQDACNAD